MKRQGAMLLSMILMVAVLGACGNNEQENQGGSKDESHASQLLENGESAGNGAGTSKSEEAAEEDDDGSSGNEQDDKRKAEPRQVPTAFPLPILDGWVEGSPFEVLTTGKKEGWSAEFFYENAIEENVLSYEQVLLEHGYQVEANALVGMSLGQGFIASGHISGILYSGTVVFDTNAEGQNRVWITFTEKKAD